MATTVGQHSVAAFTSPVNGTTPIDANTVRGNDNTVRVAYVDHDADPGIHVQSSTIASRPAAGTAGRKWITEDSGVYTLWFDDGTNWHPVSSENVALTVLAGENLVKGDVVKVTGWNNGQDLPEVSKVASASDVAFAVMTATVSSGSMGYATNTGIVQDINTNSFSAGTILYPNTSGGFTSTKPTSGNYQTVAFVLRQNTNNGVIFVEFSSPRIVESSANTASTIVLRDASGNFSAGTITAGALTSTGLVTFASLKGTGATTVTNILDEDNMASDSATALATQQSIKAYVDSKVATVDTLAEVLANGNTTGANDIIVNAGQKIRTPLIASQNNATAITIADTTGALTFASALADSNLATISTAGKVANSATTATSANTASAIVARDASGNFSAGTITATLNGAAPAGSLSGTTLASNVVSSSLTSLGTLTSLTVNGDITASTNQLKLAASTGNLGIGTATPAYKLDVVGSANVSTGNTYKVNGTDVLSATTLGSGVTASSLTSVGTLTSLTVSGDLTVDTSTLKVDSANNRVGIDTATPAYPLQVRRAGGAGSLGVSVDSVGSIARVAQYYAIGDATNATTGHAFYTRNGTATDNLAVLIDNAGNLAVDTNTLYVDAANNRVGVGTASPATALHVNDTANATIFRVSGSSGVGLLQQFKMQASSGKYNWFIGAQYTVNNGFEIAPSTVVDGDTPASPVFRLTSDGNLGLGVTPTYRMQVYSDNSTAYSSSDFDSARNLVLQNVNTTTNANIGLQFVIGGTSEAAITGIRTAAGETALAFGTRGSGARTEKMRLDASGNLGVGTTSPGLGWSGDAKALQVTGTSAQAAGVRLTNTTGNGELFISGTSSVWGLYSSSNIPLVMYTNNTERARITSGGNVGIGTSSPNVSAQGTDNRIITVQGNGNFGGYEVSTGASDAEGALAGFYGFTFPSNSSGYRLAAYLGAWSEGATVNQRGASLRFFTQANATAGATERARITSGGYFKAADNGSYLDGSYHEFNQSTNNVCTYLYGGNASLGNEVLAIATGRAAGTACWFIYGRANGVNTFQVLNNGNVLNTNGSYGTISDAKLKQDIIDAPSQWNDLKAIRFRKYRFTRDVEANPDAPYLLGVVAQELEQVSPGLVDESPDMEDREVTDEDGNVTTERVQVGTTKTVKSSILLMKAAVALQEAMARIEALEVEVAALKANA